MWEQNESSGFYFNDASSNLETPGETLSFRHSGVGNWWNLGTGNRRDIPGAGLIGTFDGSAKLANFSLMYDMVNRKIHAPNALLNGPGYALN